MRVARVVSVRFAYVVTRGLAVPTRATPARDARDARDGAKTSSDISRVARRRVGVAVARAGRERVAPAAHARAS